MNKKTTNTTMKPLKIALLDMYNGVQNEGMRCILQLIEEFKVQQETSVHLDIFEVRLKNEVPRFENYDIFISTGGPGSPLPSEESWEKPYFNLLSDIISNNENSDTKKYLFLICHSFQLACRHFNYGQITQRKSTSFGIFPIPLSPAGMIEPFFKGLANPFFVVDSRDYQVVGLDYAKLERDGAKVLCLEKIRPNVPLERAVMAIRFTEEIFGTQFHPEADAEGMLKYFQKEEKKEAIIKNHGLEKYNDMVDKLDDPDKILLTESIILPSFLKNATNLILQQNLILC
jgi:homoserine O-succinyltransferase/O-acetyltransferase